MKQSNFTYDQLIECGKGLLFGKGNAQLPLPPMLMFDRITSINENGENHYTVELESQNRFDDIDVREDEKVMRMGVSTMVIFKIREKNSDKILFTGQSIGSNAFNRISEPYSNEIAKNDAVSKLSMTIAYDIRNQLALYSKKFQK